MDKEKFEKMFERMKDCCINEEGMTECCAMMKKMMTKGKKKETEKEKKDNEERE